MTIDMSTWGGPQWGMIIAWAISLVIIAAVDGKPRTGNYNFSLSFMATAIYAVVLGFGGFWS